MSFPHKRSNAASGPLASVPYVRQGTAPPAQLYPPYRYTSSSDLTAMPGASANAVEAVTAQQVDGIPESMFPRVPLAQGTRDKRAVEEQLLLRQRMRLSAFYLDRSAALLSHRKRPAGSVLSSSSPQPLAQRGSSTKNAAASDSGIDAAVVVMSEALPAARALIPPELLETGSVRHDSHGKPLKKRARTSASAALSLSAGGEDIDAEGIFSSLAQKESQQLAAGEDADGDGEKKGDEDEDSELEEGSDAENADYDSDGDGGDYDMGQYGSDGDDYDDYGGDGDGGDGDDDYGRDDD